MPAPFLSSDRLQVTTAGAERLRSLGIVRPGPVINFSALSSRDDLGQFVLVHNSDGSVGILTYSELGRYVIVVGSGNDAAMKLTPETQFQALADSRSYGLLAAKLTREQVDVLLRTPGLHDRVQRWAHMRVASTAPARLHKFGLAPQPGYVQTGERNGTLSHDMDGDVWIHWPSGQSTCYMAETPQRTPRQNSSDWGPRFPFVEIRVGLTNADCDSLHEAIHAGASLSLWQPASQTVAAAEVVAEPPAILTDAHERGRAVGSRVIELLHKAGHEYDPKSWRSRHELNTMLEQGQGCAVLGHDYCGDFRLAWRLPDGSNRDCWLEVGNCGDEWDSRVLEDHGNSFTNGMYVIASDLSPLQVQAISAARGRAVRIVAARETRESAAEKFALAVCALAQDREALTLEQVLKWENGGYSIRDWLPYGQRVAAWGAAQFRRPDYRSEHSATHALRLFTKLTAHARELHRYYLNRDAPEHVLRMLVGDASCKRETRQDVFGKKYDLGHVLLKSPPPSVRCICGNGGKILWDSDLESVPTSYATLLRTRDERTLVTNRVWRSDQPTVVGGLVVSSDVAADVAQLERLKMRWHIDATAACRRERVSAWIPPYMPEVIEVIA